MTGKIFTRNFHLEGSHTLKRHRATGGYTALAKAFQMEPSAVTEEVGDRYAGLLTPNIGDRVLEGLA